MSRPAMRVVVVAALFFACGIARADLGFPDTVKFPPQVVINPDQKLVKEDVAEAEFESTKAGDPKVQRGRHYVRWFAYKPAAGEPALGYYNGSEARIASAVGATLTKAGWQPVYASESKDVATWTLARDGRTSWLRMKMDAPQGQVHFELVEPAAAGPAFVLVPPAATTEKFGEKDDFPYLKPPPGSKAAVAGRADGPLDVSLAFASQGKGEPVLVGSGVMGRSYQAPSTLSALQFVEDYRNALAAAGWTVLFPPKETRDGGIVIAHYTKNGRDLWARLFYENGAAVSFSVADVGGEDWAGKLDKDCRIALYGVLFDFDKATLKPESEPVLQKAAGVMKARPAVKAEVQGHTDNVGGDDYNVKLSSARASSVMQWMSTHGVDASRLTAKGYGKAQPVADNATDAGRARNRRVELVNLACKK
ncbi:MAG: OmpA family protein [Burkholderiales bacterium]